MPFSIKIADFVSFSIFEGKKVVLANMIDPIWKILVSLKEIHRFPVCHYFKHNEPARPNTCVCLSAHTMLEDGLSLKIEFFLQKGPSFL